MLDMSWRGLTEQANLLDSATDERIMVQDMLAKSYSYVARVATLKNEYARVMHHYDVHRYLLTYMIYFH
jgi:hypothetical protein